LEDVRVIQSLLHLLYIISRTALRPYLLYLGPYKLWLNVLPNGRPSKKRKDDRIAVSVVNNVDTTPKTIDRKIPSGREKERRRNNDRHTRDMSTNMKSRILLSSTLGYSHCDPLDFFKRKRAFQTTTRLARDTQYRR
jgi:hypothetical protein